MIFDHNSSSVSAEFLKKTCQDSKKMTGLHSSWMFRDKVKVFCDLVRNGRLTAYFKVNARNSMVSMLILGQTTSFLGPRHLIIRKVNIYYYTIQYCIGLLDLLDWPYSIEYSSIPWFGW